MTVQQCILRAAAPISSYMVDGRSRQPKKLHAVQSYSPARRYNGGYYVDSSSHAVYVQGITVHARENGGSRCGINPSVFNPIEDSADDHFNVQDISQTEFEK